MAFNNRQNEKRNKPTRIPVSGIRDIMTVLGKDPAFEYRFVVDKMERGARMMRFERGGWTYARTDDLPGGISVGEESVYKSKDHGSIVRFPSGEGIFSYLMKIKKERYNEDQAAKADAIDEVEQTIIGTGRPDGVENEGQYGGVKISRKRA